MSTTTIVAVAFLTVACLSTIVQMKLRHLIGPPDDTATGKLAGRGLRRTSTCRVVVGILYIGIGTNAVFIGADTAAVSFAGFSATQLLWIGNSVLDARLKAQLAALPHPIEPSGPAAPAT